VSALLIDLQIAWLNLLEHRRRTLLLGTAIATVTCLFMLLTSLSVGIHRTLMETATTLSAGHLNVGGFYKVSQGQAVTIVADYEKVARVVTRAVPELAFMVQRGRGFGKIVSGRVSIQVGVSGVDIAADPALKSVLKISSGNIDDLARPNTLLIFEQQAKTLQLKVGDAVTISAETTRGVANTMDCQVVAIARDVGLLSAWIVFISNESMHTLYQLRSDVTGVLQLHLKPRYVDDLAPIAARLRSALEHAGYRVMKSDPRVFWLKYQAVTRQGWTGQKLDITTWRDELSFMMWSYRALQGLSSVLIVILLGITVAGIMNTLWIATRERTREIGTLRAIGMQRGGVARLFLLEAGLLGLSGATFGACLGFLLTQLINAIDVRVPLSVQLFVMRDSLQLALETQTAVFAVLLMTCTTCAAALYPALRAARRRPADAMAHFG
jgi:ABC-type lipoprotein release transport system permease subunit